MAHKWAGWLHIPCRLSGPHCLRAGGRIRGRPQVGKAAAESLPPGGSPPLESRGAVSVVAHKWARWLQRPCRLGGPHRFGAGGRIRGCPQVGKVATLPLPPGGSPPLQSWGPNQKWPTSGQGGYITPTAWRVPTTSKRGKHQRWPTGGQGGYGTPAAEGVRTASERGAASQVAHRWTHCL